MVRLDDRGQAHTLEAFTAALLILVGLLFALQATAVTPLSASTSNQHIENQERAMATDLLAAADATGELEAAVLNWSEAEGQFSGTGSSGIYSNADQVRTFGEFGSMIDATFLEEGIAVNVYIDYQRQGGTTASKQLLYMGTPSDNAVVATRTVVLTDDDRLTGATDTRVIVAGTAGNYFVPDAAPGDPLYNVLEVRLVVWQM